MREHVDVAPTTSFLSDPPFEDIDRVIRSPPHISPPILFLNHQVRLILLSAAYG